MRTEINDITQLPAIVAIREAFPDGLTLDGDSEDLSLLGVGRDGITVVFTYDERYAKYRMLMGAKVREIDCRDVDDVIDNACLLTVQELDKLTLLCMKFRTFQRRALDPTNTNAEKFRKIAKTTALELRYTFYLTRTVDEVK
jgi:hypothetical protein